MSVSKSQNHFNSILVAKLLLNSICIHWIKEKLKFFKISFTALLTRHMFSFPFQVADSCSSVLPLRQTLKTHAQLQSEVEWKGKRERESASARKREKEPSRNKKRRRRRKQKSIQCRKTRTLVWSVGLLVRRCCLCFVVCSHIVCVCVCVCGAMHNQRTTKMPKSNKISS